MNLDDIIATNHISCQTKGLSLIHFGSLEPFVLHKHSLLNPTMQERSFSIDIFDKLAVNMTSCFEVEEEADEEDGRQENSLGDRNNIVAAYRLCPCA